MQAIKCELCGSNQLVKKDGYYQCEHCGTKYTIEEAKKLIVSGAVEVVTGNAEKERLLKNASTLISINKMLEAQKTYEVITNDYPDDYRGWFGLFTIGFYVWFNSNGKFIYSKKNNELLRIANDLCDDKNSIHIFFDKIKDFYGNSIRTTSSSDNVTTYIYDTYSFDGAKISCQQITDFTAFLLFETKEIIDIINYIPFENFIYSITSQYLEGVNNGIICPYARINQGWTIPTPLMVSVNNWQVLSKKNIRIDNLPSFLRMADCFINISKFNIKFFCLSDYILVGKWLFIYEYVDSYVYPDKYYCIKLSKCLDQITIENTLKKTKVCRHCGWPFKNIFSKICSNPECRKPKDY